MVDFTTQAELMSSARMLIATAGIALHNALFLHSKHHREGGFVVAYMQRGWCSHHWIFTNQALILNHTALVVCADEEDAADNWLRNYGMVAISSIRHGIEQGQVYTKFNNVAVNPAKLVEKLIVKAMSSTEPWPQLVVDDKHNSTVTRRDTEQQQHQQHQHISIAAVVMRGVILISSEDNSSVIIRADIFAEIIGSQSHLQNILHTFQSTMSICLDVLFYPHECLRVGRISYYSSLSQILPPPPPSSSRGDNTGLVAVHMWLQLGDKGGRIKGSDGWSVVNTRRLRSDEQQQCEGHNTLFDDSKVDFMFTHHANCTSPLDRYGLLTFTADDASDHQDHCLTHQTYHFHHIMEGEQDKSRRSLQLYLANICQEKDLHDDSLCSQLVVHTFSPFASC